MVRFQWHGKLAVLIDESGRYPWPQAPERFDWPSYLDDAFDIGAAPGAWNPLRQGWGSYTVLVDSNQDGVYDSPGDLRYSAYDLNEDGDPEAMFSVGGPNVYIFTALNGERDLMDTTYLFSHALGVQAPERSRLPGQVGPRYVTNYHGSGFHLTHDPGEAVFGGRDLEDRMTRWDPRSVWWESPIAWYDFDGDGWTNMVVRAVDGRPNHSGNDGRVQEFEVAIELNGNTNHLRQQSLDMQLTFTAYHRGGLRFADFEDDLTFLRGRPEADFLFAALPRLRTETRRRLLPYLDAYKLGTDHQEWESAWLLFDEDDDDCRWEEMFSIHEDGSAGGQDLRYFADKLGDRWELDEDFSGQGKLYVGKFDGRIHLFGAERGQWRIDYYSLFKYHYDEPPFGPVPPEGLLYDSVTYSDTDGNGFVDRIRYSTVAFGQEAESERVHWVVDLTQFGPDADVCELIDPRVDAPLHGWRFGSWDGQPLSLQQLSQCSAGAAYGKMKTLYEKVVEQLWSEARGLYAVARANGFSANEGRPECAVGPEWFERSRQDRLSIKDITMRPGYSSVLSAESQRQKYHNGYWLREKVFADILGKTPASEHFELRKLYYTGQLRSLASRLQSSP
jgi:hypothetical protein